MTSLAEVLAWKFDNAPGIRTREDGQGGMKIFDWPEALGPEPTQTQIDTWTAEFDALDHKAIDAALRLARDIDETFLDGFWLVFKKIAPVGVAVIDDAVVADDRAAFNQFFISLVASKS